MPRSVTHISKAALMAGKHSIACFAPEPSSIKWAVSALGTRIPRPTARLLRTPDRSTPDKSGTTSPGRALASSVKSAPLAGAGGWVCGQSIAILRARNNSYHSQALMMYLRSPQGQARLASLVVGTTSPTIQGKALKNLQIPILTPTRSDLAAEALEGEDAIEHQILQLKRAQATIR